MPTRFARLCAAATAVVAAATTAVAFPATSADGGVCSTPTPVTRPVLYGIDANNDMRLYTGDGVGRVTGGGLAWPAGGLWNGFRGIAVADFTGDGIPDVVGIDANNDMRLYAGAVNGLLTGGSLMWPAGGLWNGFRGITAGDFDGDGRADIAGIDAHADLRLYRGDGAGHLTGGAAMWPAGGLWNGFRGITAGDFTGDGRADIAGIDAHGDMRVYLGNGAGELTLGLSGGAMWPTGGGWSGFKQLTAADYTSSGYASVAGVDAYGNLRLYAGNGTGHLDTSSGGLAWPAGGGWSGFKHLAAAYPVLEALCSSRLAIMPMGDSITAGYSSAAGSGYRGFLAAQLSAIAPMGSGWLYEGSTQSGQAWWSHEGHGGWDIPSLAQYAPGWLPVSANAGVPVGLILLDIGTNDAGHGSSGSQMLASVGALLDELHQLDWAAHIIIAQPTIPPGNPQAAQALNDFDDGLPALVAARVWASVVDMRGVHLSPDQVHPDDTGYADMAGRWYGAMVTSGWLPG